MIMDLYIPTPKTVPDLAVPPKKRKRESRREMLAEGGMMMKARELVRDEFYGETRTHLPLELKEIYIVWFSKTLQNWKALVSTNVEDDMYYEVTYDGDKKRAYIDAYKKQTNITVRD